MAKALQIDERQWVSLGVACRMMGANEATLRRWADRGLIRSYRTPGGHRRFVLTDLRAVMEGTRSEPDGSMGHDVIDAALRRIRRRVHSRSASHQPWHKLIPEKSRARMRLFGRRLLTLVIDYLSRRGRGLELLAEARLVGEECGAEMARLGLPLEDTTQAYVFFRNSLIEELQQSGALDSFPGAVTRTWQQVSTVTDEVLHGIVRAYQGDGHNMATSRAR